MARPTSASTTTQSVSIPVDTIALEGDLSLPEAPAGVVLFAHGSGSGRHSPRNRHVASRLHEAALATLLVDLLTEEEEVADRYTGHLRFDIDLLADRLVAVTDWLVGDQRTIGRPIGLFGASTGGGAALVAAARRVNYVRAIVSRGGRPDLARDDLPAVQAPTLLIVGGEDGPVISLNEKALAHLGSETRKLVLVPDASHLFEEPGTLDEVARLASDWFARYLATAGAGRAG